jgi:hypothetical protein
MNARKVGVCSLTALAVAALLWTALRPGLPGGPGQAAAQGGEVTAGKFKFIAGGTTVVMIDTTSGKTYALASAGGGGGFPGLGLGGGLGMGGGSHEYAWVPITKFDDVEKYRKWAKERRDEAMKGMQFPPFPGGPGGLPNPNPPPKKDVQIEKKEP